MYKYITLLLLLLTSNVYAGPYIELGLGNPLFPDNGYIPDTYGIVGFGYKHNLDNFASIQIGFEHMSLTGSDLQQCGDGTVDCYGDNLIEAKLRFEWQ